jgi:hypothetical protein
MKATAKVKIGTVEYVFEVDEKTELDTLHKISVLANPPDVCNECKNSNADKGFRLQSNKDKEGNVYVNIQCNKCKANAKLGLYKSGGYFWHEFKMYSKGEK